MYSVLTDNRRFARLDAGERVIENVEVARLGHRQFEERPGWWQEMSLASLRVIADLINATRVRATFEAGPPGRTVVKHLGYFSDARVRLRTSVRADLHLSESAFDSLAKFGARNNESAFDYLAVDFRSDPNEFGATSIVADAAACRSPVFMPKRMTEIIFEFE